MARGRATPAPPLDKGAGWLQLAAGGIHAIAAPAHFEEWTGYGVFFAVAAVAQVLLGLALLTRAVNAEDSGPGWRAWKRGMYAVGALGNLLIVALWAVTRTVGVPAGPEVGEVEPVGLLDGLSAVAELATVALMALGWRRLAAPQ